LGVSECSDLALIDIEGDGFPYLDWHEGAINVGFEVYAAGFPLAEPQFTLTRGIVSKEEAGGETYWA
jgi:serine protease Do